MQEWTTVERLTLVNIVDGWFCLDLPVLIEAGQSYWIDREANELRIDRGDGWISRIPRAPSSPDQPR
ncbi:hypothetical protein CO540_17500 [Micromonospora sp. WMMA2032]|uniref:hypothetical protein n=1 Tax=Micromonospora sp. WMMA2032 TaxID=2039870 RepID=UPI000C05B702|nr:hypothetical protein [Micromonospora sp. WMMA2032]ATO15410.1 hypothetical protein CO540_17500 [Micromonospora sp. WMMA2032]